jgi:hypothetical protein
MQCPKWHTGAEAGHSSPDVQQIGGAQAASQSDSVTVGTVNAPGESKQPYTSAH